MSQPVRITGWRSSGHRPGMAGYPYRVSIEIEPLLRDIVENERLVQEWSVDAAAGTGLIRARTRTVVDSEEAARSAAAHLVERLADGAPGTVLGTALAAEPSHEGWRGVVEIRIVDG